jgi:hypothetical protein
VRGATRVERANRREAIIVGLFVERQSTAGLSGAVSAMLRADPTTAGDPAKVAEAVAAVEASGKATFRWSRIAVGILIAAALIAVGAGLVWLGDQEAIGLARDAAANPDFKPPTLGISAAGTSVLTLAAAWSAALVATILAEK